MNKRFLAPLWALCSACLLAWGSSAGAQTNLLSNGSFELDADGKVFPNGVTSSSWRWFAVGDATGTATIRSAAASDGAVGLELVRTATGPVGVGDSAIDRYNAPVTIPLQPRIYQYLLDAKDGGPNGGTNDMLYQLQFPAPTTSPFAAIDPSAAFETFGLLGMSSTSGTLSVRVGTNAANSSVLVDNVRVYDVTESDRVINGGFENSASRLLNWRTFSLNAGEFVTALSNDANSGAHAARIERTFAGTGDSDGGLDLWESPIPAFPGELLTITLAAKKVAGDDATRLSVILAQFDAASTPLGDTLVFLKPGSTYGTYTAQVRIGAAATKMTVAFRVGDVSNAVRHVGAYLIDDVTVARGSDANLIDNSSFESQTAGDTNGAIQSWRVPFVDAAGTVTVRTEAASAGNLGIELAHGSGTFWLDRWDTIVPPASKPGVYKVLVDAKDGGVFGGQDNFQLDAVIHAAPYPEYIIACEPGASFETFGLTAPLEADRTGIDVRLTPSGTPNQSFYADNVRVIDVTRANRVVNGGFENSTSRLLNWRGYNLSADPNEFTYALSNDAHTGAHALRIERTFASPGADSDAAVDLFNDKIAVLPGEHLEVGVWGKKLSGDADARLAVIVTEWDAASALISSLAITPCDAGSSYQRFTIPVTTSANAAKLSVAFAVLDSTTSRHVGAYAIDDVTVLRNQSPSFTGAVLQYNSDQTVLLVATSGWNDADGDAPQYLYQWKLDGASIAGATDATLDRGAIPGQGVVTCSVTAYDGIATGNTIEAAFPPSLATVIEAGEAVAPLTIDGDPADWELLRSRVLPMSIYGQGGEDMLVNIRFAWDATYLYCLVEEAVDDNQNEAANQSAFRTQPWMFDAIAFWVSFRNDATLLNGEFNPWFGFSSSGRGDLFSARLNNGDSFDETAFANGHVATGGTFAAHSRTIEVALKWSDLAAVTDTGYQPYGGLLGAVQEGYRFGCEPLLIDNGFPGQSFRTGQTHVYPDGSDADSVDVWLVGPDHALTAARNWDLFQ